MAIDTRAPLIKEINSILSEHPDAINNLDVSIRKRILRLSDASLSELEVVLLRLQQARSSLFHNILIAIRLNSGVSSISSKMGVSSGKLLTMLEGGEHEHKQLADLMIRNGICSDMFFKKTRPFFNEELLSSNRSINFSKFLSNVKSSQQAYEALDKLLSPSSDVILAIVNCEFHPNANWACRKIEKAFELEIGCLDSIPLS